MSRSYKHSPVYTDGSPGTTKETKKFANKKVRNTDFDELPRKGKAYKKIFCSYDIHDWITRCTKQEWIDMYERGGRWYNPSDKYTLEEWIQEWEKSYKRK